MRLEKILKCWHLFCMNYRTGEKQSKKGAGFAKSLTKKKHKEEA